MAEAFAVGTLVQLKSGGPKMTVAGEGYPDGVNGNTGPACTWFDGDKLNEHTFHVGEVEAVPPTQPS